MLHLDFHIIITLTQCQMPGNTSKRGWTAQEDQIIISMVSAQPEDKHKWVDVSKQLFSKTGRQRTGKQCRERWQHQLNPAILRDEWTELQVSILFKMQSKFGNKWAQIAAFLTGRTDNAVKNFFYSSVRRVLTKINQYLVNQRKRKQFKTIRQFQAEYMSKFLSVVDGNYEKRLRLSCPEALTLAKNVLNSISILIISGLKQNLEEIDQKLDSQILMMHEFRKNCKKRKQTHNYQNYQLEGEEEDIEESFSIKDSSFSNSSSSSGFQRSSEESKLKVVDSNLIQTMEIYSQKTKQTSKSQNTNQPLEQNNVDMEELEIKKVESFQFQMPMNKGYSVLAEDNKVQVWNIFGTDFTYKEDYFKMQEGHFEGHFESRYMEECDIFSMPQEYREDYLGASRHYDQPQVSVTKFKMLEVSLALDECLLKTRQSSCFEYIKNSECDL